jgi:hypothetical protein
MFSVIFEGMLAECGRFQGEPARGIRGDALRVGSPPTLHSSPAAIARIVA